MSGPVPTINYDNQYDILYLFLTPPRIAYEDEIQSGIFLRKDDETNEVIGAIINQYSKMNPKYLDSIIPFFIDYNYVDQIIK